MLDVVNALEWVHSHVQTPAIVLMSLGGPAAAILDAASQSLSDIGVTVVVAGGNSAAGYHFLLPSLRLQRGHEYVSPAIQAQY